MKLENCLSFQLYKLRKKDDLHFEVGQYSGNNSNNDNTHNNAVILKLDDS